MAGRKPRPTHLKVLTGNPGKRPLPKGEPQVDEPLGDPPSDWKAPAKRLWWELQSQLPAGVAKKSDRMLMELTVRLIAKTRERGGSLNPALAGQIRQCLAAFGLTPVDRARVNATPRQSDEDESDFDAFLAARPEALGR